MNGTIKYSAFEDTICGKDFHDAESISRLLCWKRIFIFFLHKQKVAANLSGIDLHSAYTARDFKTSNIYLEFYKTKI